MRFAMQVRSTLKGAGAWRMGALLLLAPLLFAEPAAAQFSSPAPQQTSQAVQLPLSGRTAQSNGTVQATESPIPGVTSSVNTISPTVQVQGGYAGSTPGTANMPFSGKLGFREALARALEYNLGQMDAQRVLASVRRAEKGHAQACCFPTSTARSPKMCRPSTCGRRVSASTFRGLTFLRLSALLTTLTSAPIFPSPALRSRRHHRQHPVPPRPLLHLRHRAQCKPPKSC